MKQKIQRACVLGLVASVSMNFTSIVDAALPPPRKVIAMLDSTQNFGTTRRAVNFYDVTDLSGSSVFNQQPLFSVWTGFELSGNFEEVSAMTVNPINGTVYLASFDSGSEGTPDPANDSQGDYDLYRIDYQTILNDYVTNGRARGTMYAPTISPYGSVNEHHPDHPGSTVFLSSGIQKIGELARPQDGPFFDPNMAFVNPATLMFLDNQTGPDASGDTVANDHQLRFWTRTSTSNGAATFNATTHEGGFNGNASQSWDAKIGALLDMDDGTGRSEPTGMAFVKRDGVQGVWVAEADGGGDDFSFFELDFNSLTATKKELKIGSGPYGKAFALDNDPVADPTTNDGQADWVLVDKNGHLLIGESGFNDVPQHEPKVIGRQVTNYNSPDSDGNSQNEITFGGWSTSATLPVSGGNDDDAAVTDGRFVAFDKGTGLIYFFDADSGSQPNVVADVYVFDPSTGTLVYHELNAVNHFTLRGGISFFLRGDVSGDGVIDASDIDSFFAAVADPTLGGTVTSAIGQEWYDLTGDGLLSGVGSDADELIRNILGTEYGDANLDGQVSFGDFLSLQNNFSNPGGWAQGDFNGDGQVTFGDFLILQNNFGFMAAAPGPGFATVPEPSTVALFGIGAIGLLAMKTRKTRRCR